MYKSGDQGVTRAENGSYGRWKKGEPVLAVGIGDGFAPCDHENAPAKRSREGWAQLTLSISLPSLFLVPPCPSSRSLGCPSRPPRYFPMALLEKALAIEVQGTEASEEDDETHLLNAMLGEADFNAPLPRRFDERCGVRDPNLPPKPPHHLVPAVTDRSIGAECRYRYDVLNQTLRGRFAASSFRMAVERGGDRYALRRFCDALGKGHMSELSLVLTDCPRFTPAVATQLAEARAQHQLASSL